MTALLESSMKGSYRQQVTNVLRCYWRKATLLQTLQVTEHVLQEARTNDCKDFLEQMWNAVAVKRMAKETRGCELAIGDEGITAAKLATLLILMLWPVMDPYIPE